MSNSLQNSPSLKTDRQLTVRYERVDALKPNPQNPRRHSKSQLRKLVASIKAFGFNVPVLINKDFQLLAGHGRVEAAQIAGFKEVPTIQIHHLTADQQKAFTIADNRLTEKAEWDEELLNQQLKELSRAALDFSLEVTGFEVGEIDFRIEEAGAPKAKASAQSETIHVPTGPAVTQSGMLWRLGSHRLYCGSALEKASYEEVMVGEKAHAVFTDPPYNVPIEGHVGGRGAIKHRSFAMGVGEMDPQAFTDFLRTSIAFVCQYSMNGSVHYVCMDWRHSEELLTAAKSAYSQQLNLCVWVKHAPMMGAFYRSQHELVYVFKNGKGPYRNNVQLGKFGRNRSNVWNYSANLLIPGEEGKLLALHATVKPAAMVADAIMDSTARGDIVLDNFLGSGTTLIAATRVDRRCCGIEIDPLYVDTAIRRWQILTRDNAIDAVTGRTFNELAGEQEESHAR